MAVNALCDKLKNNCLIPGSLLFVHQYGINMHRYGLQHVAIVAQF